MKRPIRKLIVKRETIRVIRTVDLGRAAAGDQLLNGSGAEACTSHVSNAPLLPRE
jgi:hypothetical protein